MNIKFLPAAITPVYPADFLAATVAFKGGVKEFESRIAQYFSHEYAFTFGSLMRTVYACFIGLSSSSDRKIVVLPRYTCPSFIHGVLAAGLKVEFCDVVPETLSIDLNSLSNHKLSNVLAVVCTNLFGLTSEVDKIIELCKRNKTYVIEGVDYGIGTEYLGKKIGAWGDVTILNFQEGKAIPIGGGAVVTSLPFVKAEFENDRKKSIPNYFTMCGFIIFSRPFMYGIFMFLSKSLKIDRKKFSMEDTIRKTSAETDFKFNPKNFNQSLSDFQGRLGSILMDRLEMNIIDRLNNAKLLSEIVKNIPTITEILPHKNLNKIHYVRFPILVKDDKRDYLLSKFLEQNIEASPMYIEHGVDIDAGKYPGASNVSLSLLTLPCHPYIKQDDLNLIKNILLENMG